MKIKDSYSEVFGGVERVLVVLAHPDDMEINCGGLMARLVADKKLVRLVVTTTGGKGMKDKKGLKENEFASLRVEEQINYHGLKSVVFSSESRNSRFIPRLKSGVSARNGMKAGRILGLDKKENFNLGMPDGEFEDSVENIERIAFQIREFRPEVVITHNPQDVIIHFFERSTWVNHRDHRNTALVTLDAVYPYARDRGFFPQHFDREGLAPHMVKRILLADCYTKAGVRYFAIDKYVGQKKTALKQHLTAFDPADADDYLEENKFNGGYFEPLGYYEVY